MRLLLFSARKTSLLLLNPYKKQKHVLMYPGLRVLNTNFVYITLEIFEKKTTITERYY